MIGLALGISRSTMMRVASTLKARKILIAETSQINRKYDVLRINDHTKWLPVSHRHRSHTDTGLKKKAVRSHKGTGSGITQNSTSTIKRAKRCPADTHNSQEQISNSPIEQIKKQRIKNSASTSEDSASRIPRQWTPDELDNWLAIMHDRLAEREKKYQQSPTKAHFIDYYTAKARIAFGRENRRFPSDRERIALEAKWEQEAQDAATQQEKETK